MKSVIKFSLLSFIAMYAVTGFAATATITNRTDCLLNLLNNQAVSVPAKTVYIYTNPNAGPLTYSGVSVSPGNTQTVPMGTSINVQPPLPTVFTALSTNASAPNIGQAVMPAGTSATVIQQWIDGLCPQDAPCVNVATPQQLDACGIK